MVFADLLFLFLFLPLCLIIYFRSKKLETRNLVLIIFSFVFYAWGEPLWVILLYGSAAMNWFLGLMIEKNRDTIMAKVYVTIAIVADISLLVIFKYTGFIVETINGIFRTGIPVPQIRLPIGISFFTFQAMSYILDVHWDTVKAQKRFKNFLLYLTFFPQLIAGPIVRYVDIEKELMKRKSTYRDLYEGAYRLIIGLSKKVILANNLYAIVETFFGQDIKGMSMLGTWYTVIIYSLYVYFDFSGYSDMAIGMGRMFGFHFNENFVYPFTCKTIAEFWQRWHISLGSFFRDYLLYVPLFGQRRKYMNLFLVWFCTGLWHGASWNYVLWGLYFGFFMFFEQHLGKKTIKKWPLWWKHIYSKLVIIIGFGIFYFEDLRQLGVFFLNITGIGMIAYHGGFADRITWMSLVNNLFLIIFSIIVCVPVIPKVKNYFENAKNSRVFRIGKIGTMAVCVILLLISSMLLVNATSNPFLYWRF